MRKYVMGLALLLVMSFFGGVFAQSTAQADPQGVGLLAQYELGQDPADVELTAPDQMPDVPEATTVETPVVEAPVVEPAQTLDADEPEPEDTFWVRLWAYLRANIGEAILLILAAIEVIVRLTPTETDNAWFAWLRRLIDGIVPNLRRK